MKKKIIIGIHGLDNKPPRKILQNWWRQSICEGLSRNNHPHRNVKFKQVYWAHFFNSEPQDVRITDETHPLYVEHPYTAGKSDPQSPGPSKLRKSSLDILEFILDKLFLSKFLFLNFDPIGDWIIRKKFKDLGIYYDKRNAKLGLRAKMLIRQELAQELRKHQNKDIMLIAHSMGSIVAYDVLTYEVPEIKIHTFVTLGSPLGLPAVMKKIFKEQKKDFRKEKKVATPENIIRAWYNFSDLRDRVSMNYNLSDDYRENSFGVRPQDFVVNNDYERKGKKSHHKSYGYLRTPEISQIIHEFLSEGKPGVFEFLRSEYQRFFSET